MIWTSAQWGQVVTLLLMALALGMDAFSLGIGVGLRGIRLRDIAKISAVIAAFHVIMPLIGIFMGQYITTLLGSVATTVGGVLLMLLGTHMIYSSVRGESVQLIDYRSSWGIVLFAFSVSVDAFSVGVSLGMFASDILLTVLMFGVFGGIMSVLGLMLGRRAGRFIGGYGEAFGGIILLVFGIRFLI